MAAIVGASALSLAPGVSAASEVSYRDGRLWFDVVETPTAAVLAAVSKSTGLTVVAPDSVTVRRVSVRAAGLSVEAAIDRILRGAGYPSHVMIYERNDQLRELIILEPHGGRSRHELTMRHGAIMPADATLPTRRTDGDEHPASVGRAGAASAAMTQATPGRAESLAQHLTAWSTLNAAERRQVRRDLQRLPFQQRLELTLRHRRDALGLLIEDEEAYQANPLAAVFSHSR